MVRGCGQAFAVREEYSLPYEPDSQSKLLKGGFSRGVYRGLCRGEF